MKKIIIGFFLLLTTISAQDEAAPKWSIYAGVTSMSIDGNSAFSKANRVIGNSYGITYAINKRLTIGMGYSSRGAKAQLNKYNAQDVFEGLDLVGTPLSGDVEVVANAIEFWSSVTLLDKWGFSLWTGPIFSHIYSYDITDVDDDITISEDGAEADYGLMFGASFPLQNKLGLNIGYYQSIYQHGIKDDSSPKFNNLFLELSYKF